MIRDWLCTLVESRNDDGSESVEYVPQVPIVRCRDCLFSTSMGYQCTWFNGGYLTCAQVQPEGYCAFGESKEEA